MAHPTTITGSIGVIAMKPNFKGLMDKLGVEADLVKTGRWKDFWSPFRPASPEEKELMQGIIDDFFRRFQAVVVTGRKLPPAEVRKLSDGRIFTGAQAQAVGLVDRVGYLDDAIKLAQDQAGLTEARVVVYTAPTPTGPPSTPSCRNWTAIGALSSSTSGGRGRGLRRDPETRWCWQRGAGKHRRDACASLDLKVPRPSPQINLFHAPSNN